MSAQSVAHPLPPAPPSPPPPPDKMALAPANYQQQAAAQLSQQQTAVSSSPSLSTDSQLVPLPSQQQQQQAPLVYPSGTAKHDAVVADRNLFYDTLNKFHAALGTRLMIPTIGGKELDLHLLYVEVTARGGLEQVIRDRKWKEVTVVFNFPPTTTSASFVLRKYYVALLHHYEQVYFFGAQGQLVPAPAPLLGQSPGHHHPVDNGFTNHASEDGPIVVKRRRWRRGALDSSRLYGVDLGASVGHTVSGIIDGKFEHGYLVTVSVGTEKLRGVLYHMPSGSLAPQFAAVPGMASGSGLDSLPEVRRRRRRRRKDEMPKKDPNAPKPNRSGYNFFFQEQHMRLKALHPEKDKEISRMIGELWNKQTEDERAIYQERGVKDKERYKREMEEYRGRLKTQAFCEGNGDGTDEVSQPVMDTQEANARQDHQGSGMLEEESCPMALDERRCEALGEAKEPTARVAEHVYSGVPMQQGQGLNC